MTPESFFIPAAVAATGIAYQMVIKPNVWRLPPAWRRLGHPIALWVLLVLALLLSAGVGDALSY